MPTVQVYHGTLQTPPSTTKFLGVREAIQFELRAIAPGIQQHPPVTTIFHIEHNLAFPPRPRLYHGTQFRPSAEPVHKIRRTDGRMMIGLPVTIVTHLATFCDTVIAEYIRRLTIGMHLARITGPLLPRTFPRTLAILMTAARAALHRHRKPAIHGFRCPFSTFAAALCRH